MDRKEFKEEIDRVHKRWIASQFNLEIDPTGEVDFANGVVAVKLHHRPTGNRTRFAVSK